jgi:pimeloyl-ACP methyl ester carboxylesterase
MARLVLVHGAFGTGENWRPVIPGLEAAGHTVETVTLPGQGDDPTPLSEVTLDAYANRIIETLEAGPKAVLVAHSMGGMSVTQAASRAPELIEALIYVSAFMPNDGESLVDLSHYPEAAGDMIQANLQVAGDPPVGTMSDEITRQAVFNCCTDEQFAMVLASPYKRAQPLVPMTQPFVLDQTKREQFEALPRRFVVCLKDNCIMPAMQRLMAARNDADPVVEIGTDHAPFLSATDELVETLDRMARLGAGAPV